MRKVLRIFRRVVMIATCRPQVSLPMIRLGSEYGGWWIPRDVVKADWVCLCAGVGEDITFDLALIERYGCDVVAVDPTPRAAAFLDTQALPTRFRFAPVGLWSEDSVQRFYAPADASHVSHSITNLQKTDRYFEATCLALSTLMKRQGLDRLDLLKLDIEGAEFAVLNDLLANRPASPAVICVEFDQPATLSAMTGAVRRLKDAGYAIAAVEGWNYTFVLRSVV